MVFRADQLKDNWI